MTAQATVLNGKRWSPIPAYAGIGLKPQHYQDVLCGKPSLSFVEIHTENYMGSGGSPHRYLTVIAADYPLSFHGVGMSLGGIGPLDGEHLRRWKDLIHRYEPALISEHLAWGNFLGVALHDLLPIPYTEEALQTVCAHVLEMQDALGRAILLENPSTYITISGAEISEPDFLVEVARRTNCGLLLDVNNVYISAKNYGFDAYAWIDSIPAWLVGEIHLAGHAVNSEGDTEIRIDDHGSEVCEDVWDLYRHTLAQLGPTPTLIEWDTNVPAFGTLLEQSARANHESERSRGLRVATA